LEGIVERDYQRRVKPLEDRQAALPSPIAKRSPIDELRHKHGEQWGLRGFDSLDESRGDAERLRRKSQEQMKQKAQETLHKLAVDVGTPIRVSPPLVKSIQDAQAARQLEVPSVFEFDPDSWNA
jgi:hypothetical protein